MIPKKSGKKGLETEEIVRSYFLGAGFFVVRGVKFRIADYDLTDIDLWLYERSATLARRRLIIDIKDNYAPRAAERLFFIRGLAEILQIDATGVVTSDSRTSLRDLARRHNVLWIDGVDLQRLKASERLKSLARLSEEEFNQAVSAVDASRSSRKLREAIEEIRSAVADRFGPASANRALDAFQSFAVAAVESHPNSVAASVFIRSSYLAAALASVALDFTSGDIALRPQSERVNALANAIRFGEDARGVSDKLRFAEAAIREFAPTEAGIAEVVRERFMKALEAVPAEALAEVVVKMASTSRLFDAARMLEEAAYARELPSFDKLGVEAKSVVGALCDFASVDRSLFAESWNGLERQTGSVEEGRSEESVEGQNGNSQVGSRRSDDKLL